jgi:copper ion binding protein
LSILYCIKSPYYDIVYQKEYIMKTTLKIEGMSCDHCVKHVTQALKSVAGVKSAKVSLKDNSAQVEHGDLVTQESLKAAVTEAGYEAL